MYNYDKTIWEKNKDMNIFRMLLSKKGKSKDTTPWYWPANFTYRGRYDDTGVTTRFLQYAECTGNGNLKVFDVGTSEGLAISDMKKKLQKHRICITTIGLDPNEKVKKEAEKNLNKFILGNILDLQSSAEFDVVICSKMILHAEAETRSNVVKKCSEFLKPYGAMITDADAYNRPIVNFYKSTIIEWLSILLNLKKGVRFCYKIWKQIQLENEIAKMYLIIGSENTEKYSTEIMDGWNLYPDSKKIKLKSHLKKKLRFSFMICGPNRRKSAKFKIKYNSGYDKKMDQIPFWKKLFSKV